MNKLAKVFILCMSLFFIQATIFSTVDVQAAEKTMYVKAKGDIILREKPNKDAKRLGTIKNHSALKVISTSNGWSYVNTGKKKGYVYASTLVNKNPKTDSTAIKDTELEKVKKSAIKGEIPGVTDVKIGSLVKDITKKYGLKFEQGNIRDDYLIYKYPRFSIMFSSYDYNTGVYIPEPTKTTKVLEVGNKFSKSNTLKEITNVFGKDYSESAATIGGQGPLTISYLLGDYYITLFSNITYYVNDEIVVPPHDTIYNLSKLGNYSKIPNMKFTNYWIRPSSY